MDFIIKETLKILKSVREISIKRLLEKLEQDLSLPSFNNQKLIEKLKEISEITIENDKIYYESDKQRLTLYIEDKSEDKRYFKVINEIYTLILKEEKGLNYQQIQKQLSKKFELNQISHYCRKLYDLNFVIITCKSHFKQVIARKYCQVQEWQGFQDQKSEDKIDKIEPNYYREFDFFSNLQLNLQDALLEQEVRIRMNKCSEGKSFSRLIDNLVKEKALTQIAERKGKIFMYRYKANTIMKKWPNMNNNQLIQIKGTLVIEFCKPVLLELQQLLNRFGIQSELSDYKIGESLHNVILGENNGKRKTQVSQQKINRFASITNYIYINKIATLKDLKQEISENEKSDNSGTIDTRTIHSLLKILETIEFIKIHIIRTVIVKKECERWLISHWTVKDDDHELIDGLNKLEILQIDNKVNVFVKQQGKRISSRQSISKYEESNQEQKPQTRSSKKTKIETKIKQEIQSFEINNVKLEVENIYQSDDDKFEYTKISVQENNLMKLIRILDKLFQISYKDLSQLVLEKLKPNYDVKVANEIFQRVSQQESCASLLLGLEQKCKNNIEFQNNISIDDWEIDTKSYNQLQHIEIKQLSQDASDQEYENNKKFKRENQNYDSLKSTTERLKNYLLRYPNQSIGKLMNVFTNLNIYVILKKLLLDNTIEIKIITNKSYNLDEALKLYTKDEIKYKINESYLIYF